MKHLLLLAGLGLAAMPASISAAPFTFLQPLQPPRVVQVMAHGGACGQAPQNTRPALLRCVEDGFEWAEIDVRRTRDNQHVLWNNDDLGRLGLAGKKARDLRLQELRQLDAGAWFSARHSGEQMLTLPEALNLAKGKLNLCLNGSEAQLEVLAREILDAGMEKQVLVYARPERLGALPSISRNKIAIMFKWHAADRFAGHVDSLKPEAVEIDASEITPNRVAALHRLGIRVQAMHLGNWDKPEFWDKSLGAGADWIKTDLPEEVLSHALWRRLPQRPVRISFHRGAGRYAPENTLPAFEKAIRMGADFVEFDVRTTSDGKFYLLHDSTLDGRTDGHGPIADTPSAIVATLSAGVKFARRFADIGLPTLDDFLKAVQGKVDLYFDAKAIAPEALSEAVDRYHLAERTVVYQSAEYLLRLKAINPRIRALPPLSKPEEIATLAATLRPYAVDAKWTILSKEVIDQCHAHGMKVFSDALGAHEIIEQYQQAIVWGIDLIQTDYPLRVYRAIELRAASAGKARF